MSTANDPTGLADHNGADLEREANELERRLVLVRFELKRRRDPANLRFADLAGLWAGYGDELVAALEANRAETIAKLESKFDDVRDRRPHPHLDTVAEPETESGGSRRAG